MANPALINKEQMSEIEHLLVRVVDSAEGYRTSCDAAKNTRFEFIFDKRARQRDQFASEIRSCLAESGSDASIEGSTLGSAHRMFVELRSKLDQDDEAVFKEIVRGESALVESYESALEDIPASSKIYSILTRQLSSVRADLQDAKQKADMLD